MNCVTWSVRSFTVQRQPIEYRENLKKIPEFSRKFGCIRSLSLLSIINNCASDRLCVRLSVRKRCLKFRTSAMIKHHFRMPETLNWNGRTDGRTAGKVRPCPTSTYVSNSIGVIAWVGHLVTKTRIFKYDFSIEYFPLCAALVRFHENVQIESTIEKPTYQKDPWHVRSDLWKNQQHRNVILYITKN